MGRALARRRHCKHSNYDRLTRRSGAGAALNLAYVGTGNGVLSDLVVDQRCLDAEDWTITFSAALVFGVVGSTLGAQTGGIPIDTSYVGTGDGTLDFLEIDKKTPAGETWTITLSDADNYTVTGSTLGLQTNLGTVGTAYVSDDGEISFTITAGGTPFVNTDAFTVVGKPYTSDLDEISFVITTGSTPYIATDAYTFTADTVLGYQNDIPKSDRLRFNDDQAQRLVLTVDEAVDVHDVMCADGDSAQEPGGRSNQYTYEDVQDAADPSDIGLV